MKESKEAKFRRVATRRTNKVLETLHLLSNCSNRGNYSYSDKDVNQIFNEIEKEMKRSRALFKKSNKNKFSL